MRRITPLWGFLSLIIPMIMSSCSITRCSGTDISKMISTGDSVASTTMGDSIYSIIVSAGEAKVTNLSISLPENCDKELTLKGDAVKTLLFLIENPANYSSDTPVYGIFNPSVTYTFTKGKRIVTVAYDFGLKKWAVKNANGENIIIRDLKQGEELLRFTRILYPADPLLQSIEKE